MTDQAKQDRNYYRMMDTDELIEEGFMADSELAFVLAERLQQLHGTIWDTEA